MRQKHVPLSHIAKVMMPGIYYSYAEFSLLTGISPGSVSARVYAMMTKELVNKRGSGKNVTVYTTPIQIERMKNEAVSDQEKRGKHKRNQPKPKITRSSLDILLFSTAIV